MNKKILKPENLFIMNSPFQLKSSDKDGIYIGYKGEGQGKIPTRIENLITGYDKRQVFNVQETLLNNLPYLLQLCIEESQIVEFEEIKDKIIKNEL